MVRKNARALSAEPAGTFYAPVELSFIEHYSWGSKIMNGTHKGHSIIISAARTGKLREWKSRVKVIWSDDGHGKVSTLDVAGVFRERGEAERGGLMFAKKWIDDGKPDLTLEER